MKHITLTDEEIRELLNLRDIPAASSDYNKDYGWLDMPTWKPPVKHQWVPTLLIVSTVYTCSKCGAKKEKTTGDYCEDDSTF